MLGKLGECLGDVFCFGMAGEIDVEDVFPVFPFRRARLDLGEVDVEVVERFQGVNQ